MNREEYAFVYNINGTGMSGIITMTNPPKLVCYCDEENSKTILKALNPSLPPAEGAEQRIRVRNILQDFYRRGEYELEQAEEDIMRLFQPQPTAEGAEEIEAENLIEFGNMIRDEPNGDIAALAEYFIRTINLKTREK